MAKTDNLTDFLTNTANAIRMAEGSTAAINPQDFEAKITALKLSVQTADANATAADILSGKTAWVNGTKIAGSIGTKAATTIIPGTLDQTIDSGVYLAGAQTIKGDSNLTADNIKSGTGIFGVTGTYEGSTPNLQSKSVTYTANGTATITPDEGYDGLSSVDVTVDVASGGGGGAGFSVTFPATVTNWDSTTAGCSIVQTDGTVVKMNPYSTLAGKTIPNIIEIFISGIGFYFPRMTVQTGKIMFIYSAPSSVQTQTVVDGESSRTYMGNSASARFIPLADTVISTIEMYNTD